MDNAHQIVSEGSLKQPKLLVLTFWGNHMSNNWLPILHLHAYLSLEISIICALVGQEFIFEDVIEF
jgi:hypothetical protein